MSKLALQPARLLSSSLSPLLLAAALSPGCGGSAVEQAASAAGGREALLGMSSQMITATGQRFDSTQTKRADDPAYQVPGDFQQTLLYDLKSDQASVAWVRPTIFGFPLMYSEIAHRDTGYFKGGESFVSMAPQSPMLSSRVAAVRKHLRLLHPHLLLRRALEAPDSVTVKDEAVLNGASHHVLELADAFRPIRLFVNKDSGLVSKLETVEDDPVAGDSTVEVAFDDYREAGGLVVPYQATLSLAGVVVHKEKRSAVTVNAAIDGSQLAIPSAVMSQPNAKDAARGEAISEYLHRIAAVGASFDFDQSTSVQSSNLAAGVYLIGGAGAHTLAIELGSQIVVAEAPADDARSRVVIAEIRKLIPGKPIKYIINTHHHHDHAGGVRTYVAEGATVVTSQLNESFFRKMFAAPHKARPDLLEERPAQAKLQAVGSSGFEIAEGARKVRVLPLATSHADGMLMVYVEDVQLLLVADVYSPGFFPANAPIMGPFLPFAKELYTALMSSGLSVQTIAGVHGVGTATLATLRINAGF
jgi:glyoxylase-like metal-dependent hydrolase (beta-lactamase superfamily II)